MKAKLEVSRLEEQVYQLKQDYEFEGVLHFTDFSNLRSIFDDKELKSRRCCESQGIKFLDGAEHSVLDKADQDIKNHVRFYYRGKSPTLYNNEGIKMKGYCNEVHIPIPVYLLFDEKLIYLKTTKFSKGNATNSEIGNTAEFFESMDWNTIFHDTWFEANEREYIIKQRQAELLSEVPVSLSYLKNVIFRCEADKKRAINIWGENELFVIDSNLFSEKNKTGAKKEEEINNYITSYKLIRSNDNKGVEIALDFNKNWEKYSMKFEVLDEDNNIVENIEWECFYENMRGNLIKEPITFLEKVILKLNGDLKQWYKLNIYLNDFLYIEEFIEDAYIQEYSLEVNDGTFKLYKKFKNLDILNLEHKIEIINKNCDIIKTAKISFGDNPTSLEWELLQEYTNRWWKINYYIEERLCISEIIN